MSRTTAGIVPASPQALALAACRANFYLFAKQAFVELHPGVQLDEAPYIEALAFAIQEVADGRNRRLNINVPPRHLKSFLVSVALPAWLMGRDPSFKTLFAAYGQDLADEHARNFLKLVRSHTFGEMFPRFTLLRSTPSEVSTTLGGFRRATGAGGSMTGFGADLIIIDDLTKAADAHSPAALESAQAVYRETILSRFNNKAEGRLIAIQQRIHENDLSGMLLENQDFTNVVMPASAVEPQSFPLYNGRVYRRKPGDLLNPVRESQSTLDCLRREMGDAAFSAQYQQNPIPPGGNRVRWGWFPRYDNHPERGDLEYVVQSWDTAVTGLPTSDYSVCMTFGRHRGRWFMLDVHRQKHDYPELRQAALAQVRRWQPELVLIEPAGTGQPLARDLRDSEELKNGSVVAPRVRLPKDVRLEAQTARLEDGFISLPAEATWLADLRHELLGFPNARYDDQVDALSQFVAWAGARRAGRHLEFAKFGRAQSMERRSDCARRSIDRPR